MVLHSGQTYQDCCNFCNLLEASIMCCNDMRCSAIDCCLTSAAHSEGVLFMFTGSSTTSKSFRADELTRLVTEAGQADDIALGQGSLEQALALADKYGSPKWDLVFTYTSSLVLTWQHQTEVVVPVVRQIFPALMQKPSATVHQLLLVTWPELQVGKLLELH